MSVRKRPGSPYWWYSFNEGGHRFRGSTERTSKREAEEVERDQRQRVRQQQAVRKDWTLQVVLSTYYLEHARDKASGQQILGHFADLQRILGKDKRTSKLTNGDLMDYRARRRGEKRRGRFPAANSINREFAYLRAAYEHCRRYHKQPLPDIDWKELKAKEPEWRKRFLSREDEAPAFLAAFPIHAREIVICAIVTGLRRGNIFSLDWEQVRLSERIIAVTVKGGRAHEVKIPPALMAILSTRAKRKGKVFDATNFRRHWYAALKEVGMKDFKFHDLRHTFASWARKAGIDLPTIQEALKHSDISMTMRYANVEPDEVENTFDRVSATLLGTISGTDVLKTAGNGEKPND